MTGSVLGRRAFATAVLLVTGSFVAPAGADAGSASAGDHRHVRDLWAAARSTRRSAAVAPPTSARRSAASVVGVFQAADRAGDTYPVADARADIQPWGVFYYSDSLTLALKTAEQTDPYNDPVWDPGASAILWGIDINGDDSAEFGVLYERDPVTHALTARLDEESTGRELCPGQVVAGWTPDSGYTVTFPPTCLGGTGPIRVGALMLLDLDPNGTSGALTGDDAPDGTFSPWITAAEPPPPPPLPTRAASANGWTLDAWGGLHPFSTDTTPAAVTGASYWPGWNIARGVSATSVTSGFGLVVDGWGGLHPFKVGTGAIPTTITTNSYWPGWDIVRGVALMPDGSGGFTLDGWGGLHGFSTTSNPAPTASGGPYWKSWDVARGIAIAPDGKGGYVVDARGGLHPFAIGAGPAPGAPGLAPYWRGGDNVRGVTFILDSSGGYTVDRYGMLRGFDTGAGSTVPAAPGNAALWSWDIVRGVAVAAP